MKKLTDAQIEAIQATIWEFDGDIDRQKDFANAFESEVLRINGLTAESAEQREQGQAVAWLVEAGPYGKTSARKLCDTIEEAREFAAWCATKYQETRTKDLYTAEPIGVQDGYFLPMSALNEPMQNGIEKLIAHAKRARWTNATVRKDSVETSYEADWIKFLVRLSAAPQPEDMPAIFKEQSS